MYTSSIDTKIHTQTHQLFSIPHACSSYILPVHSGITASLQHPDRPKRLGSLLFWVIYTRVKFDTLFQTTALSVLHFYGHNATFVSRRDISVMLNKSSTFYMHYHTLPHSCMSWTDTLLYLILTHLQKFLLHVPISFHLHHPSTTFSSVITLSSTNCLSSCRNIYQSSLPF